MKTYKQRTEYSKVFLLFLSLLSQYTIPLIHFNRILKTNFDKQYTVKLKFTFFNPFLIFFFSYFLRIYRYSMQYNQRNSHNADNIFLSFLAVVNLPVSLLFFTCHAYPLVKFDRTSLQQWRNFHPISRKQPKLPAICENKTVKHFSCYLQQRFHFCFIRFLSFFFSFLFPVPQFLHMIAHRQDCIHIDRIGSSIEILRK